MAKFLSLLTGRVSEVQPIVTSAGAGDASKMIQLDSNGLLDASLMPSGITPDQKAGTSNGSITAKDLCYVETAGTIARATAAAGTPKECIGWALTSVATGQPITIQLEGKISGLSGLTPGARYYLSDVTPGGFIIAPGPSGAGKILQFIGTAVSATELNFEPDTSYDLLA